MNFRDIENFSDFVGSSSLNLWEILEEEIYDTKAYQVENSIVKNNYDIEDFCHLISPAAENYLEEMAEESQKKTRLKFGNTIQLYAPLYLSNECKNVCTYCGFSVTNKVNRIILEEQQILKEINYLKKKGFEHVLVVTGEDRQKVGINYFKKVLPLMKENFSSVSIEVQPMNSDEYAILKNYDIYGVLVYQETYNPVVYKEVHPMGKKSNFEYRLNTPDRLGKLNYHKIGLGVLLGLSDWRIDSAFCFLHLSYLKKKYWQTNFSISLPRIRSAEGIQYSKTQLPSEKNLAQVIFSYRICLEELEISLSTRESQNFRNNIMNLGITTMSAESATNPGGYVCFPESLNQFDIDDNRSVEEITEKIFSNGLSPVWKDWNKIT